MPKPLDFEAVRWKTADAMDEDDVKVLLENKDKLNDEEKDAFADILQASEPLPDNPLEHALLGSTEGEKETIVPEVPETPKVPETPITPEAPTPPAQQGMTQEQMDSYLETKKKQWDEEGKTKAQQKEAAEKLFDIFAKDEVPADWNVAVNKFAPAIIDAAKKQIFKELDDRAKEQARIQGESQAAYQKQLQTFEGEFANLSKEGKIPQVADANYKQIHDAIIDIGVKRGSKTITEAYTAYMQTPVEFGGGYQAGGTNQQNNQQIEKQKEAAGKISSGKGVVTHQKGLPLYQNIHNMSMDDLLEARLAQR